MFYLVDKPLGISSNLVAKILKGVLRVSKIGFAGTLDPLATGLMIIGADGSSRLFPLMEHYTKTYETTIRLDGTSSSYDREQPIESIKISKEIQKKLTKEYIESVISHNFLGDIMQIPQPIARHGLMDREPMSLPENDIQSI
jgi:tRNA pseudouridine55 synthase